MIFILSSVENKDSVVELSKHSSISFNVITFHFNSHDNSLRYLSRCRFHSLSESKIANIVFHQERYNHKISSSFDDDAHG